MAVPLYGQKYSMSCWAASMRMMLASRVRMVSSDDEIAARTNDQASLHHGLDPNSTACLRYWGFRILPPQCYDVMGFAALIKDYAPLWVACDVRFPGSSVATPHIRVVTGAREQSPFKLFVNDPGPVGLGSRYEESYQDFTAKNELLGAGELSEPSPVYIAYLP